MTRTAKLTLVVFSAIVLAATQLAYGQAQQQGANDARADKVLKSVKVKMGNLSDLSAVFKYSLENRQAKANKPMAKQGTIKMKKNKFRIEFPDQSLFCDGQNVWNYLKNEKEVSVSEYDPNEGFSMERMFRVYQADMKARYDNIEATNGKQAIKLSLYPTKTKSDYFRIEMWVDETQNLPLKMKVYGKNGSIVTYELTNVRVNGGVNDNEFTFRKELYPGVEVVDMR